MNKTQEQDQANEEKGKLRDAADDKANENKGNSGKPGDKDETVLAEVNRDSRKDKQ